MREASEAGHVVLVEITDVSIYQEIEKEAGQQAAELLCKINPRHILSDEDVEMMTVRKKSWFQRMRRR